MTATGRGTYISAFCALTFPERGPACPDAISGVVLRYHTDLPIAFQMGLLELREIPQALQAQRLCDMVLAEVSTAQGLPVHLRLVDKGNGAPFHETDDDLRMRRDGVHLT